MPGPVQQADVTQDPADTTAPAELGLISSPAFPSKPFPFSLLFLTAIGGSVSLLTSLFSLVKSEAQRQPLLFGPDRI